MANFNYVIMLGYEPYDYVERTSEGLLRCMRSIRRDFSSKSYYPERLVFYVCLTKSDGWTLRRNAKPRTFTLHRYSGQFSPNLAIYGKSKIDEDIVRACIDANAEVIK